MTEIRHHRFSIEAYERMGEEGIIAPDARVELIEGEVVDMAPIGSRHMSVVNRLTMHLTRRLFALDEDDPPAIVSVQNALRLPPASMPQPDVALLRPRGDVYAQRLPEPEDVLLLIEVADATLLFDRTVKVPLYARAGVAEVWLLDLPGRQLLRYREPAPEGYRRSETLTPGNDLAPDALPLEPIPVADLVDL